MDLEKAIAWAKANGATPEMMVTVRTVTGEGSYLSNDERGQRGSAAHYCTVEALTPTRGVVQGKETLASVPSKVGNEDSVFIDDALIRPVLGPIYEALMGSPLPTEAEGSEKCLADGTNGKGENTLEWSVWSVTDHKGHYYEARYSWVNSPTGTQEYAQRVVKTSFRASKKYPGEFYLPGTSTSLFFMTAEQTAEVFEEMDLYVVR